MLVLLSRAPPLLREGVFVNKAYIPRYMAPSVPTQLRYPQLPPPPLPRVQLVAVHPALSPSP
jgi:hypothetical protein